MIFKSSSKKRPLHQEKIFMQKRSMPRSVAQALWLSSSLLFIISTAFLSTINVSAHATTSTVAHLQTTCPAPGTARAAIMPPITLGTHINLFYIFNDVPPNTSTTFGRLMRYDVTTGRRSEIINSGLSLQSAQVSANGQWILFLTTPDPRGDPNHSALLQLVLSDGQDLQTLYCAPTGTNISNIQWASDQRLVAFAFSKQSGGSGITLLNIRNGSLQTDLLNPRSGALYRPLTWLDTTRLYVLDPEIDAPSSNLFILDTRLGPNQNTTRLHHVFTPTNSFCWDADSSYDARSLFTTSCTSAFNTTGPGVTGSHGPSAIAVRPATGGTAHTIFTSSTLAITAIRAINPTTLLVLVQNYSSVKHVDTSKNGLWELYTNGTGFTRLTSDPNALQAFSPFTQFPWSNVSRDGQRFALQVNDGSHNNTSVLIGSLRGGAPITVATTRGASNAELVGWTAV
jgi:eukaryotic-like serine/threonine-protein kinase